MRCPISFNLFISVSYSYLHSASIYIISTKLAIFKFVFKLPASTHISFFSLSTGATGYEAVKARASFSSIGKHPKSLKHHLYQCKYSYDVRKIC